MDTLPHTEEEPREMPRVRFDPVITAGSLFTSFVGLLLVPFMVWLVSKNFSQDARLDVDEAAITVILHRLDYADQRSEEASRGIAVDLRRLGDKIDHLSDRLMVTPGDRH